MMPAANADGGTGQPRAARARRRHAEPRVVGRRVAGVEPGPPSRSARPPGSRGGTSSRTTNRRRKVGHVHQPLLPAHDLGQLVRVVRIEPGRDGGGRRSRVAAGSGRAQAGTGRSPMSGRAGSIAAAGSATPGQVGHAEQAELVDPADRSTPRWSSRSSSGSASRRSVVEEAARVDLGEPVAAGVRSAVDGRTGASRPSVGRQRPGPAGAGPDQPGLGRQARPGREPRVAGCRPSPVELLGAGEGGSPVVDEQGAGDHGDVRDLAGSPAAAGRAPRPAPVPRPAPAASVTPVTQCSAPAGVGRGPRTRSSDPPAGRARPAQQLAGHRTVAASPRRARRNESRACEAQRDVQPVAPRPSFAAVSSRAGQAGQLELRGRRRRPGTGRDPDTQAVPPPWAKNARTA